MLLKCQEIILRTTVFLLLLYIKKSHFSHIDDLLYAIIALLVQPILFYPYTLRIFIIMISAQNIHDNMNDFDNKKAFFLFSFGVLTPITFVTFLAYAVSMAEMTNITYHVLFMTLILILTYFTLFTFFEFKNASLPSSNTLKNIAPQANYVVFNYAMQKK